MGEKRTKKGRRADGDIEEWKKDTRRYSREKEEQRGCLAREMTGRLSLDDTELSIFGHWVLRPVSYFLLVVCAREVLCVRV